MSREATPVTTVNSRMVRNPVEKLNGFKNNFINKVSLRENQVTLKLKLFFVSEFFKGLVRYSCF